MRTRPSPVTWFRDRPVVTDGLLALLIAGLSLAILHPLYDDAHGQHPALREPDWVAYLLTLVTTLPLTWRRRFPELVLAVVGSATVLFYALQYSGEAIGVLLATYTVAAHCPRRKAFISLVFTFVGLSLSLFFVPEDVGPVVVLVNIVIFATAWIIGSNLQARRHEHAALAERAGRLENEREERARRAVADERNRIARELHDVVAHSVSVMVVQAAGARRTLDRDPDRAKAVIAGIEETGRQALAEMRRLLGVLRTDDEATDARSPQPGLSRLDDLVDNVRAAGLPVQVIVEGTPQPLTASVDLSAYRIVQEALTNSLKHAGPASADVVLRYGAHALEVIVRDTGRGSAAALDTIGGSVNGAGHGLVGMRERVTLFGGELRAGPRRGGGYEVVPAEQLVDAIRVVAAGDAVVAPSVTRLDRFASHLPTAAQVPTPARLDGLTDRELDVLKLMARGLSNAEIAAALLVSETTVKTHVGHVLTKLGLRDRVQAVVLAYEVGLVSPGTG